MQAHRKGEFPRDLIPELAELGVFGASLHGYGCAGMNSVAYGLVMQVRMPTSYRHGGLQKWHARVEELGVWQPCLLKHT